MTTRHETVHSDELVLRKQVRVERAPEDAFRLYTEGFGSWWPLRTHSVEGDEAVDAVFEGRVGGRIYEIGRDGTEHTWGTVLEWAPPGRFVHTWHPGRAETTRQVVEVTFRAAGEGTIVELEHRGWDALEGDASTLFASYDTGWALVLEEAFARAAA